MGGLGGKARVGVRRRGNQGWFGEAVLAEVDEPGQEQEEQGPRGQEDAELPAAPEQEGGGEDSRPRPCQGEKAARHETRDKGPMKDTRQGSGICIHN